MYGYCQYQQLNLSDVGFKTKLRIVICEALSRKNNEILGKAMELKFNKVFWSVSTKNGLVYYRLDQKSRLSKISSLSSLNAFFSTGTSEDDKQHDNGKEMVQSHDKSTDPVTASSNNADNPTANSQQPIFNEKPQDISIDG